MGGYLAKNPGESTRKGPKTLKQKTKVHVLLLHEEGTKIKKKRMNMMKKKKQTRKKLPKHDQKRKQMIGTPHPLQNRKGEKKKDLINTLLGGGKAIGGTK